MVGIQQQQRRETKKYHIFTQENKKKIGRNKEYKEEKKVIFIFVRSFLISNKTKKKLDYS